MAGVSQIDNHGTGELVVAYATVILATGALKLSNLRGHLKERFHITRLDEVFEIYETEGEAILSFYSVRVPDPGVADVFADRP